MILKTNKKYIKTLLLVLFVFSAGYLLARAGGGGGRLGGSGGPLTTFLAYILAPFFLIYIAVSSALLERKRNKAKHLIQKLETEDAIWNHRKMMARIDEVFLKVQIAWTERNQDLAKDYMSDRIYAKHKIQTDEMLKKGRKNVLDKINLEEAMIISVADYKDDASDSFSAHIKGSMIDYDIDENTNKVLSGYISEIESFTEIWHFIRDGNIWVLDEINQNITIGKVMNSKLIKEL
jgi:hypothetical protein